jgi:hypothetical protein
MEININQLMQYFTTRKGKDMDKLMSIPISKCPAIEEDLKDLPESLHSIFYILFPKEEEPKALNLFAILRIEEKKTPMPICNKLLVRNEAGSSDDIQSTVATTV